MLHRLFLLLYGNEGFQVAIHPLFGAVRQLFQQVHQYSRMQRILRFDLPQVSVGEQLSG